MAGVSEMPFRVLARRLGASAAPTELVSAKGLTYGQTRTQEYLRHDASEQPFWVQLFGGDVEAMVAGAERACAMGAKILDINMGCPVRKVTRHGAGSGLLCDPVRAAQIVAALVRATNVPVTVKIRAGWDGDSLNYLEMGQRLVDAGCAAIALHARTRAQGYSGQANWRWIEALAAHVDVPVIGNGDVFGVADAHRMQRETHCAGVMIGRGALGNPWIFAELAHGTQTPTPLNRWRLIEEHLEAHLAHVGDERRAIKRFRQHLMWYARGLVGASAFRRNVMTLEALAPVQALCEAFFAAASQDEAVDAQSVDFVLSQALG